MLVQDKATGIPEDVGEEIIEDGNKSSSTAKFVSFSINIPKFHFLGDYVSTIRLFGTTDSYSSESASLPDPLSTL